MRLIIEEAQSRSLREGDFYDEIGITPALNLAQRLASDALTQCFRPEGIGLHRKFVRFCQCASTGTLNPPGTLPRGGQGFEGAEPNVS
jgi:hypothetical protein